MFFSTNLKRKLTAGCFSSPNIGKSDPINIFIFSNVQLTVRWNGDEFKFVWLFVLTIFFISWISVSAVISLLEFEDVNSGNSTLEYIIKLQK